MKIHRGDWSESPLVFILTEVHTPPEPMTYSPSYSDLVMGAADEYDGTLSWHTAVLIAAGHSCLDQFHIDYGVRPFCVDAGEFLVWLGY